MQNFFPITRVLTSSCLWEPQNTQKVNYFLRRRDPIFFLTALFSPHYFSITITKAVRFLTESCKGSMLQAAGLHRAVDSLLSQPCSQNVECTNKAKQSRKYIFFHWCRFAKGTGNFTDMFTNVRLEIKKNR